MKKMGQEQFDSVYNKLKDILAVVRIHPEENRPPRVFRQDGVAYALRWKGLGPQPTPEQFALGYDLEIT